MKFSDSKLEQRIESPSRGVRVSEIVSVGVRVNEVVSGGVRW